MNNNCAVTEWGKVSEVDIYSETLRSLVCLCKPDLQTLLSY